MRTSRVPRAGLLGAAALLLAAGGARADVVYLADGFALPGQVKRESTNFVDPRSGQQVTVARLNGFYMVDDLARRIVFSAHYVQDVEDRDTFGQLVVLEGYPIRRGNPLVHPILGIAKTGPWKDWNRRVQFRTAFRGEPQTYEFGQRLAYLTPYLARVDNSTYRFTSWYLTREFGPETVRKLLAEYPKLKPKAFKGKDAKGDAIWRWHVFRFLLQAGWYPEAEEELDRIAQDFKDVPGEKEKVAQAREHFRKLRAQRRMEEIEQAHKAGRHRWAQEQLAAFPEADADDRLLTTLRSLRSQYELGNGSLERARRFLKQLPPQVPDTDDRRLFAEAARAIRDELDLDNVARLDAFLRFAQQAERRKKRGRPPEHGPGELLALAVSGWLLGSPSSQADAAVARRLWQTRDFVLRYQQTSDEGKRRRLLADYRQGAAVPFDELAQLIGFLPPPEPEKVAQGPVRLQAEVPGAGKKVTYYAQLPPECRHGRPYPVLFVLHPGGGDAQDMLGRWSEQAARHGYILVAPAWEGLDSGYDFTTEAQAPVVEVLRDLRRRFQVDSDRVFLFGLGQGGVMAYDIGLSHPDLFAGVIPMGARPRWFAKAYWSNARYLPFYVVDGERDGENPSDTRRQFQDWVMKGYPALYVEYKGRGMEWFGGELPSLFDWMGRKKRAAPFPELGKESTGGRFGEEMRTMRAGDNRFYWLSTSSIERPHLNDASSWSPRAVPAALVGRIGESNQITVEARGVRDVTVWLGLGMIDFDRAVTVRVVPLNRAFTRPAKPSLETLLEDFYDRGDRQRLFLARVDLKVR